MTGLVRTCLLVGLVIAAGEATARAQARIDVPPDWPPLPPRNRYFQLIPYIGIHSYWGQAAANVGTGLHIGGMIGSRLGDLFSINGELTLDVLDVSGLPQVEKFSELDFSATVSPLVSVAAGKIDLAFGPKLGVWGATYDQTSIARGSGSGTFSGVDFGANFAGFTQVRSRLWVGGLASFDLRTFRKSCFTPTDGQSGCSTRDLPAADKVAALSLLLMFSI